MDCQQLQRLNRKELQTLAKSHGIKANIKSAQIISQLLKLHPDGIPSTHRGQQGEASGRSGADGDSRSATERLPTTPVTQPKKLVTPKRRPLRKTKAQRMMPEDELLTQAAGSSSPTSLATTPLSLHASRKAASTRRTAVPLDSEVASTSRNVGRVSSTRDGVCMVIPESASAPQGAGSNPRAIDGVSNVSGFPVSATDPGVPQLAASPGPQYSVPFAFSGRGFYASNGPFALRPDHSSDDAHAQALSEVAPTDDDTGPGVHPAFMAPRALDDDGEWTPTTPTRTFDDVWAAVKAQRLQGNEPRATEAHLEAIVRKVADISKVHRERLAELHEYEYRASVLEPTVKGVRKVVQQERANCERLMTFLAYWNPVEPRWKDAEIWDRACPTRIDENGMEVEIVSDDEDAAQCLPPGAKPTEILMRRIAFRADDEDDELRLSEIFPLTASRHLAVPPSSAGGKRRRVTPVHEADADRRPNKRLRRGLEDGENIRPNAPALDAISEDAES
ncbi:hypothetical protein BN946_scf184346.g9 [Trametes cinnabarina]|uniref:Uncharacterized protein n=1 Tax=Pycnoporus cinnabarinus TaxID=5643 RepID=A0A060STT8_PYCCI|nr:hypothetical protein BN946_scf184346.g9 [Trametes cinnabarina]